MVRAIRATFERRKTPMPSELPIALTSAFADDPTKVTQWTAFLRKSDAKDVAGLRDAIDELLMFVRDPLVAASAGQSFEKRWRRRGPWSV